jgi:hypothetical protein
MLSPNPWRRSLSVLSLLCLITPALAHAQGGLIDPLRSTDWSHPGVAGGIINRTTICQTLNPGASAANINSAISACNNGVVFLNAGTYNLSSSITFNGKSNVTLRGAGADKTLLVFSASSGCIGLQATVCIASAGVSEDNPPNSTTWTGGYARGTSVITVGSSANMKVGTILILDQLNDSSDTGGIFVCSSTNCTEEGGNSPGRTNRGQMQFVKVTAINGNQVSIAPPIRMPNWRASQSPGVWFNGNAPIVTGDGVEDLTLDVTNALNEDGVTMVYVSDCWVKGIRTINPDSSHVWIYKSMRITVRDNYFYGGQGDHSVSYGVESYASGDNLVENNIFQHVTGPIKHNGPETGSVIAYNFSIDDNYTAEGSAPGWEIPTLAYHEVGISYILHESNDGLGVLHDVIHGTTHFNTEFRNHLYGDVWNNPPKNANTAIINVASYGRFFNVIGNVLGRTGYYTTYETNLNESPKSIYALGWSRVSAVPDDPNTKATLFRWGNYDTVTGTVRFETSEVPSGLAQFANPIPATQMLPPSLYLSGRPGWWSATIPWPAIGPDVTAGNVSGYGGHANKIPARVCYETTPKTNGILNFNRTTCYASSTATPPSAPTGFRIIP